MVSELYSMPTGLSTGKRTHARPLRASGAYLAFRPNICAYDTRISLAINAILYVKPRRFPRNWSAALWSPQALIRVSAKAMPGVAQEAQGVF